MSFSLVPRCVVDKRVLEQRPEDEGDADAGPDVDGLGVGHGRQRAVDGRLRRGHGQEGGDAERDPRRDLNTNVNLAGACKRGEESFPSSSSSTTFFLVPGK